MKLSQGSPYYAKTFIMDVFKVILCAVFFSYTHNLRIQENTAGWFAVISIPVTLYCLFKLTDIYNSVQNHIEWTRRYNKKGK